MATERKEVKTPRVFVSNESARHRWKAYIEIITDVEKEQNWLDKVRGLPGAQKRGTWGTQLRWVNSDPGTWATRHFARPSEGWSVPPKSDAGGSVLFGMRAQSRNFGSGGQFASC